jgi:anti-anti-sigma factor
MSTEVLSLSQPYAGLTVHSAPPRVRIELRGELDFVCAEGLTTMSHPSMTGVHEVVIDLGRLDFLDLAGVRALLAYVAMHESAGREVTMTRPRRHVRRLFELAGHSDRLPG